MMVVAIHGLGGDRRQVLDLLEPVLPEDAIAPDVRAHGDSPLLGGPADFQMDALARELDLPAGPITLVGISMGAALCLRIALDRPADVERLVLIRPAFTDRPLPANLQVYPVIGQLLAGYGAEEAEWRFRRSSQYQAIQLMSKPAAAGLIRQIRAPRAAERAIRLIEIPRNRAYVSAAELAGLRMPATVVAAPRDPVHPLDVARAWARDLPNARLVRVPARAEGRQRHEDAVRNEVAKALGTG